MTSTLNNAPFENVTAMQNCSLAAEQIMYRFPAIRKTATIANSVRTLRGSATSELMSGGIFFQTFGSQQMLGCFRNDILLFISSTRNIKDLVHMT